jgi:hypothetical protein
LPILPISGFWQLGSRYGRACWYAVGKVRGIGGHGQGNMRFVWRPGDNSPQNTSDPDKHITSFERTG